MVVKESSQAITLLLLDFILVGNNEENGIISWHIVQ